MMLLFFFSHLSLSWSGEPHQIIASIAKEMITEKQNNWLTELFSLWPSEQGDMIDLSNWQDWIRSDVGDLFLEWHFSDEPYIEEGFKPNKIKRVYNITEVIKDELDSIYNTSTTSLWALAFNLRNLIHFVGDAHCPVHAVQFYGEGYADGDYGANKRVLNCSEHGYFCGNLHKLWDSVILNYQHSKYKTRSMPEFYTNISNLQKEYTFKSFGDDIYNDDPKQWINKANDVAKKYGYGLLVNETFIDDRYFKESSYVAKQLVTLAGYRLGIVLQKFFRERDIEIPIRKFSTSEVVAWILDSLVFLVIIAYTLWIILGPKNQYGMAEITTASAANPSLAF